MLTEKICSRNIRHVGVTINAVTQNTSKIIDSILLKEYLSC